MIYSVEDERIIQVINRFNTIAEEIQKQSALITCKFNVKPQYVLLGVDIENTIRHYGHINNMLINPSKGAPFINDPCEFVLRKFFELTPIVDKSLPLRVSKDLIQVVCPSEAYS